MNQNDNIQAIIDTAKESVEPKVIQVARPLDGTAPIVFAPTGMDPVDVKEFLDEWLEQPERRTGTATLEELQSFVDHVNRFKDGDSAVFARRNPPGLLAVLDYHPKGSDSAPRFCEHRSAYTFPLSDEWKAWIASNGKKMGQAGFAEFLESRIIDVRSPDSLGAATAARLASIDAQAAAPWRLLQLSRGLAIKASVAVENAVNLSSGEAQITYNVEHQDKTGKVLDVPTAFVIAIPVFQRGVPYEIAVRLRYRLVDHAIHWFYELLGHDVVFEDAFKGACDEARTGTELPLYVGSPEAG